MWKTKYIVPLQLNMPYKKDFNSGKPPGKNDKPYGKSKRSDSSGNPRRDKPKDFRERDSNDRKPYDKPRDKDELAPPRFFEKPFKRDGDFNDRPKRSFNNDRPGGDRPYKNDLPPYKKDNEFGDRPKRNFGSDRPASDRPNNNDRSYKKGGNFGDGPKRNYGSDRPNNDRPYNNDRPPYKKDSDFGDRPKRNYGSDRPNNDRPYNNDRPPYKKDNDFGDRPKRNYGTDRPNNDRPYNNDRPPYKKDNDFGDRPKRNYGTDKPNNDRPYSNNGDERKTYKPKYDPEIKNKPSFRERNPKTFGERKKELLGIVEDKESIRLNKYVANSGICSRREADELIAKGLVSVNGKVILEMGHKVAKTDTVMYEGRKILPEPFVYVIMNKPKDFLTTTDDDQGRKTVMDLLADKIPQRIFPIGRLDRNTTGVLLLTNDGDVTQALTHPSFEIKKVYHVELDKKVIESDLDKLVEGITLEDGEVHADAAAFVETEDKKHVGIEIHNGRNRIVRRMFEHLGYQVEKLDRVSFGIFTKKDLPRGKWRHLSASEVGFLMKLKSKM
jgi:23S rRNA pseudouridine2605 synthase